MHLVVWGLCFLLLPYFLFLGVILGAAIFRFNTKAISPVSGDKSAVPFMLFLIPAHDEEAGIQATVQSLFAQDYPRDRFGVIVVADNCSDQTALMASLAGATVISRTDLSRRGKGYALEYALWQIEKSDVPWDAVVVIDADTTADPEVLRHFSGNLQRGVHWQQGFYTVRNPDASWRTELVTLALALFNGVWPMGLAAMGLGSPLRGNGMAFSRAGLKRHGLKAYGLAEDLELAWRLRLAGEKVEFVPSARVSGLMVSRGGAVAQSQRLRWEHGRALLRQEFGGKIWGCSHWSIPLRIGAYIDLYFPPLARLGGWLVIGAFLSGFLKDWHAVGVIGAYACIFLMYVLSPCMLMGLTCRQLRAVVYAPRYFLWKVFLAFSPKPRTWVRTARE